MYHICCICDNGRPYRSVDYPGNWHSVEVARAHFYNEAGTWGRGIWWKGAPPYCIQDDDGKTQPLKLTRNERQRIRRRAPAQKAKEAAASRVSYWRNRFYDAPLYSQLETDSLQRIKHEQERLQVLRG